MWLRAKSVFLSLVHGVNDVGNRASSETAAAFGKAQKHCRARQLGRHLCRRRALRRPSAPAPFLSRGGPDVSLYRSGRPLGGTVTDVNEISLGARSGTSR